MSRYDTSVKIDRDDGLTFRIEGDPWALALKGMDDFNAFNPELQTTPLVLEDGSALANERVGECLRTVRALCRLADPDEAAAARNKALSFFAAHHTYTVHVSHRGTQRWCEGLISGLDCKLRDGKCAVELSATFLCPDPWMRDEDGNESAFGDSLPRFGFPFVSHAREVLPGGGQMPAGFIMSQAIYDGMNSVYNTGDAPTGYQVVWKAKGYIMNPTIWKDGKFVRVIDGMQAGDTIVVDFEASPPTVTKNGENAIQKADRASTFTGMAMGLGKNTFTVEVGNPENRSLLETQVLFHRKRNGV